MVAARSARDGCEAAAPPQAPLLGALPAAATDGASPVDNSKDGSPPREVPLRTLHNRSAPLGVASRELAQGLDSARRLDALEWLVQAFDALNLPDAQLYAAFGLLDRFAAASPAPISAGPGAFALVLAAMIVALKVSGTQRDLERAKRLVVEVSGSSRPWQAVRKAEICILRRLGFRACTPTSRDLLDRLLTEALKEASAHASVNHAWHADERSKCSDLARFLLELGLVHEPEAIYGLGRPPLAAALSALLLALIALGAPLQCAEALQEPLRLLEGSAEAVVSELCETMRQRWVTEERRHSGGSGGSAVVEKWVRRTGSLGAQPPAAGNLKYLKVAAAGAAGAPPEAVKELARAFSPFGRCGGSGTEQGGGSGGAATAQPPQSSQVALLARAVVEPLPLAVSAAAHPHGGGAAAAAERAGAEAPPAPPLPTPRPALGPVAAAGGGGGGAAASQPQQHGPTASAPGRYPPAHLMSQLSRAVATENLSSRPLATQQPGAQQGGAAQQQAGGGAEDVGVQRPSSDEPSQQRSPEPLVELTHVLNMVAPRPAQPILGGNVNGNQAKHKPPSVAAELLVSSALRMQWPVDRRKVGAADAAGTCREAVVVLQEAAQQLLAAATTLEGGGGGNSGPGAAAVPAGGRANACSDSSKRRRTFGGPSPGQRAPSPLAGGGNGGGGAEGRGPLAPRGSPPVRFAGLRV